MTLTIELPPEVERRLSEEAARYPAFLTTTEPTWHQASSWVRFEPYHR